MQQQTETLPPQAMSWIQKLSLLQDLTPGVYLDECIEDVKTFRDSYPKTLPLSLSNEDCARCLGLLNTNQVELEDFGGSGLFVGTAILEHSCDFNCSYTTSQNLLFLTATRTIRPGARLSIDYG